jgi:hypothetical protein
VDYIGWTVVVLLGAGVAWIIITALNNDKHPPSK